MAEPANSKTTSFNKINLISYLGEKTTFSSICGNQFTLLYLIKPWDGITLNLVQQQIRAENDFYGRIKPLLIFCNTKRSVANNYMAKLDSQKTFYIDDNSEVISKFSPQMLPMVILLDSHGTTIFQTSSPDNKVIRQLSSNPEYYMKKLKAQTLSSLKTTKHNHPVHSPWGPPVESKVNLSPKEKIQK